MSSVVKSTLHRRRLSIFLSALSVFTRQASTSSKHSFPFPPCTNPTPHEIFHLPHSASQDEIKTRYYELVKVYHPDANHGQRGVSPSMRNAQFRAITQAYGVLRGRGSSCDPRVRAWEFAQSRDEVIRAELRRRSRRSSSSSTTMAAGDVGHDNVDDTLLWYSLVAFILAGMIVAMGSVSSHMDRVEQHSRSAAANLAQARAEAQVYGMERRRKIRERVRAFQEERKSSERERTSEDARVIDGVVE